MMATGRVTEGAENYVSVVRLQVKPSSLTPLLLFFLHVVSFTKGIFSRFQHDRSFFSTEAHKVAHIPYLKNRNPWLQLFQPSVPWVPISKKYGI